MSQPRPARPKDNLMQTLLIAAVVFMGFQLFFNNPRSRSTDSRTPDQILAHMRELNGKLYDIDIAKERRDYVAQLNAAKLPKAEKEAKEIEALVLVVHTEFYGGLRLDSYDRVNRAYMTLQEKREWFQSTPLWKKPIQVAGFQGKGAEMVRAGVAEVSPQDLYNQVTSDLKSRAENHLVVGIFPGFKIMDFLVSLTGRNPNFSYAFAAFILALMVRLIIWPLAGKQYRVGRQMGQLAPLIRELQNKHKPKDGSPMPMQEQQALQAETMKLYKTYGLNPMAGCLPALVQLPFFLLVYQFMLDYRFEFANGRFLWIQPDAGKLFGVVPIAPNLGERDHILVTIYAISILVSTLLTPVSDPTQVRQQRLMGLMMSGMFTVFLFFWPVPAGFALYWTFLNILATAQLLLAYRTPLPPLTRVNAPNGAVIPVDTSLNGTTKYLGKTGKPKSHRTGKSKRK